MAELKPCPFCGSNARLFGGWECWYGRCPSCDSEGPTRGTEDEATRAWNARADGVTPSSVGEIMRRVDGLVADALVAYAAPGSEECQRGYEQSREELRAMIAGAVGVREDGKC